MTPYLSPPMLTQGPITIATLQQRAQANPYLPQSGTLAPVSCPDENPCLAPESNTWFWLLLAGTGALLLMQRKKGEKKSGSTREYV